jgi:hypothetical protein
MTRLHLWTLHNRGADNGQFSHRLAPFKSTETLMAVIDQTLVIDSPACSNHWSAITESLQRAQQGAIVSITNFSRRHLITRTSSLTSMGTD